MTYEDEEFNRIERESKLRMEAVRAAMPEEVDMSTAAMKLALEALEGLEALLLSMGLTHLIVYGDVEKAITALREALANEALERMAENARELGLDYEPAKQEPVAWRDHVEQRLLTWRQSFVNKSGDQLALDDFMDKRSLDDLIDFVCSEYTSPPPQRKPLTDEEIWDEVKAADLDWQTGWSLDEDAANRYITFARAIEAAHGIKEQP